MTSLKGVVKGSGLFWEGTSPVIENELSDIHHRVQEVITTSVWGISGICPK